MVLNRHYVPVNITSVKRAFIMLYGGVAKAVGRNYETFDFDSWAQITALKEDETIKTISKAIKVPRVIILVRYDRMPRKETKFNRINIFKRDGDTCQYCGRKSSRSELTIDHVIPRSLGGKSIWENVVCCCMECNRRKGGRVPEEAGIKLITKPKKPLWNPFSGISVKATRYSEWEPFLSFVDMSYWNAELEE